MKTLQVWSWAGWYQSHIQTNEVVAAHSAAEVARLAHVSAPARLITSASLATPLRSFRPSSAPAPFSGIASTRTHPNGASAKRIATKSPQYVIMAP